MDYVSDHNLANVELDGRVEFNPIANKSAAFGLRVLHHRNLADKSPELGLFRCLPPSLPPDCSLVWYFGSLDSLHS